MRTAASQRCACGGHTPPGVECTGCRARRLAAESTHVSQTLRGPGRPLEPAVREEMEARFSHDFSRVRVHTDGLAANSARAVHAHAYTVGRDVVFGSGLYAPKTKDGRRLLAHELAHVVQQRGATGEPAHVEPAGSALERAADSAGRAAADGHAVTQPLGTGAVAIARQMIGNENQWVPQALQDEAKKKEFEQLWARLRNKRQPDYPERTNDLIRLAVLSAEAKQAHQARSAAVKEAEEVAASIGLDEEEEAEEAAVLSIAKKAPEPKFLPGGFTNKMIYGEADATLERIEQETGRAKDPRRFKDRFKAAKKKAPIKDLKEDYYESIWDYGLGEGLFAEHERNIVFDELRAPARARNAQERKQAETRRYNEQIQRFKSFRSQLNLGFIQGALLGRPGVPGFIRMPYTAYGVAHTGVELYRGVQSGDPTRVVGATLPLAAGYGFMRIAGVGQPPPGAAPPRVLNPSRGKPVEAYDYDVVTAYNANPASVKKMASNSWAQYVWELHGGEGIHPVAWRHPHGRVVYVNEARWPAGRLSEINQPHELIAPGQGTQAPRPATVDPRAGTIPGAPPPADPFVRTAPGAPPPVPAGPATQPSAPPARPLAPQPRAGALRQRAFEATEAQAVAAYQRNPASVYRSPTSSWHQQLWNLDRGPGIAPPIFRSGNVILVDLDQASAALLLQLGRGMRR